MKKTCQKCGKTPCKAKNLCANCYRKTLKKLCEFCGKFNVISTRKKGKIVCQSCNKKYFTKTKKKECNICKGIKRIDKIYKGENICSSCYKKHFYKYPTRVCNICKENKEIIAYKEDKPLCASCYRIHFYKKPKRKCNICQKEGLIGAIINNKKYCMSCYKKIIRKEEYKALDHKRKARIKGNGGNITGKELKIIKHRDKSCVYCGSKEKLSYDHIIPLTRGGKSSFNNYVLACLNCNSSKGNKDVLLWCKQKKLKVPKIIRKLLKKIL
jgi:5-methylcytosine-specific restriction endonuclease McrA